MQKGNTFDLHLPHASMYWQGRMAVLDVEGFERGGFSPFIAPNRGCLAEKGREASNNNILGPSPNE